MRRPWLRKSGCIGDYLSGICAIETRRSPLGVAWGITTAPVGMEKTGASLPGQLGRKAPIPPHRPQVAPAGPPRPSWFRGHWPACPSARRLPSHGNPVNRQQFVGWGIDPAICSIPLHLIRLPTSLQVALFSLVRLEAVDRVGSPCVIHGRTRMGHAPFWPPQYGGWLKNRTRHRRTVWRAFRQRS
jgi:hypothetical protein